MGSVSTSCFEISSRGFGFKSDFVVEYWSRFTSVCVNLLAMMFGRMNCELLLKKKLHFYRVYVTLGEGLLQ